MKKVCLIIWIFSLVLLGVSDDAHAKPRWERTKDANRSQAAKETRQNLQDKDVEGEIILEEIVLEEAVEGARRIPIDAFTEQNPFPRDKKGRRIAVHPGDIPYTLGVDDVLLINVRMHEDISGEYVVSPEGTIFISLLGEIRVLGLVKEEIAEILKERLSEYIIDIELSVAIVGYRSKFVYVLGEVYFPGKIPMRGNIISLRDAIVDAGLPTDDAAGWRSTIIRPSDTKPIAKHVSVNGLLYHGALKYDYYLQPNDVVYIPMTLSKTFNKYLGQIFSSNFGW